MLRRNRVVLFAIALLAFLPSVAKAGEGGLITLVNGTPYNWRASDQRSYQMNWWGFPDVITAGSTATLYVEWSQGIFETVTDDSGVVTFSLEGTGLSFQLQATAASGFDLRVVLNNFSTLGNPTGSTIDLGWKHDGSVNFILAGEAGNFTSSNLPNAWMHENLSVLGSQSLRHLCIPGSHDAGMSTFTDHTAGGRPCNTVTQTKGVLDQLRSGVRYFDIRPVITNGQFVTGHYTPPIPVLGVQGANGQSLDSIIDDVNTYTAANPELVVLSLSHDLNRDAGDRWLTSNEWCDLLTHLRQRLNYRFPNSTGVDLTALPLRDFIGSGPAVVVVGRPDDPSITLDNLGCGFVPAAEGFYAPHNFPLFDSYSNTDDLNAMRNDQLAKKLSVERPGPDAKSFLLSWTLTQDDFTAAFCPVFIPPDPYAQPLPLPSVLALAAKAKPSLYQDVLPVSNRRTYPNVLYIDDVNSPDIAALAMAVNSKAVWDKPKGYVIYKGFGSDTGIYVANSPDSNLSNGGAWRLTRMNPAINTSATPGAVSFAGGLYVFYKGSGDDSRIYLAQPEGGNILAGGFWNAQPLNPAINTSTAPEAAVFNNTLYMFYKGAGGDANIYIARAKEGKVFDGNSWEAARLNSGINTTAAPKPVVVGNSLYLFYRGLEGNIWIAKPQNPDPFDGNAWVWERLNPAINTSDSPGVVVYSGTLYMFYKGFGGDANIYIARANGGNVFDGNSWSATRLNPGINTTAAPKPVVVGNSLYLFYRGMEGNIWIAKPQGADLFNGNAWTWERLNPAINTSDGPGAAVM
jgi:hypothetical protein